MCLLDEQATELRRIRSSMLTVVSEMETAAQSGPVSSEDLVRYRARCAALRTHCRSVIPRKVETFANTFENTPDDENETKLNETSDARSFFEMFRNARSFPKLFEVSLLS